MTRVTRETAARQNFWNEWLAARVPAELQVRICGVSDRDGTLTVFAKSPAWSARLRYAILELEGDMRAADPTLRSIEVRVRPRG